jgi:hypothetical protein
MAVKKSRRTDRTVIFEIKTSTPLPVGQQVFVAGNQDMLGRWKPDGLPLTRMGENLWTGIAILSATDPVEYKITRGSWDSEEIAEDGNPPMNTVLKPGGDTTIRRTVYGWYDERPTT